jgi:hypothetical protein
MHKNPYVDDDDESQEFLFLKKLCCNVIIHQ